MMSVTDQPSSTAGESDLGWALHRLSTAWAAEDALLARRMGLSAGDYTALKHVAASDGIGAATLARRLGMSTGSVNALINRLAQADHLQRRRDRHDARRLTLHLSAATQATITAHYSSRSRAIATTGRDLTGDERAVILDFLDRAASAATGEPEGPPELRGAPDHERRATTDL